MSYTGVEIFNQAISVLDELSDSGAIVESQVAEYKNRAPYLVDMWQKEMAKLGSLYNIEEYENSDEDSLYKWLKFDLPSSMKAIKDIIFIDGDSQIHTIEWKKFGNNDIYFYFTKTGTVRMLFVPIPVKITALSQSLEVDDITAISGAYYLAEHFAMADMNDELARRCRNKFNELKADAAEKAPSAPAEIRDIYGISNIK